jgi:hypothetical protein
MPFETAPLYPTLRSYSFGHRTIVRVDAFVTWIKTEPFHPAQLGPAPFNLALVDPASFYPTPFDLTSFDPAPLDPAPFDPVLLGPIQLEPTRFFPCLIKSLTFIPQNKVV